jgi:hypothetical protein
MQVQEGSCAEHAFNTSDKPIFEQGAAETLAAALQ